MRRIVGWSAALLIGVVVVAQAEDWASFRGPKGDGHSSETELLKTWPQAGPKVLWSATGIGGGYGSASIAKERIYVTGMADGQGTLFCYDLNGKLQWKKGYGREWNGVRWQYPGARTTPTVHDGKVYIISGYAVVACFDAAKGDRVWSVDALTKFGGKNIQWGISESPLIEGDNVICTPGGAGATVVALNLKTGKTAWKTTTLSHRSAYCSPIVVTHGGTRQIITITSGALVGINPEDGKVIWQHAYRNRLSVHANSPIYKDGYLFLTSGYGEGSQVVKLADDGKSVTRVWRKKVMDTHHGGAVAVGDLVYGTSSMLSPRNQLVSIDLKTGATKKQGGILKGSVISAAGMLYCYDERGTISLVKATKDGFSTVSSFRVSHGAGYHWAHPSISNGILYIRHGGALIAYDIRERF